jgi:hypothetical protein
VMIVSFYEEAMDISRIAHFAGLELSPSPGVEPGFDARESSSRNAKIKMTTWERVHGDRKIKICELNYSAGVLAVEEFLLTLHKAMTQERPWRVLINNTNLLKMRFPDIYQEKLAFPAISALLKHYGIIGIIIDVAGDGSDHELSYGLRGMADYIFKVETLEEMIRSDSLVRKELELQVGDLRQVAAAGPDIGRPALKQVEDQSNRSYLAIANIRGKIYATKTLGLRIDDKGTLFIEDVKIPHFSL